ncbi:MAG: hypothetical protein WC916_02510 [Candidatus Woesearchaeota archaeon]
MEKNNKSLLIVGIVAIVAIVGIVVIMTQMQIGTVAPGTQTDTAGKAFGSAKGIGIVTTGDIFISNVRLNGNNVVVGGPTPILTVGDILYITAYVTDARQTLLKPEDGVKVIIHATRPDGENGSIEMNYDYNASLFYIKEGPLDASALSGTWSYYITATQGNSSAQSGPYQFLIVNLATPTTPTTTPQITSFNAYVYATKQYELGKYFSYTTTLRAWEEVYTDIPSLMYLDSNCHRKGQRDAAYFRNGISGNTAVVLPPYSGEPFLTQYIENGLYYGIYPVECEFNAWTVPELWGQNSTTYSFNEDWYNFPSLGYETGFKRDDLDNTGFVYIVAENRLDDGGICTIKYSVSVFDRGSGNETNTYYNELNFDCREKIALLRQLPFKVNNNEGVSFGVSILGKSSFLQTYGYGWYDMGQTEGSITINGKTLTVSPTTVVPAAYSVQIEKDQRFQQLSTVIASREPATAKATLARVAQSEGIRYDATAVKTETIQ